MSKRLNLHCIRSSSSKYLFYPMWWSLADFPPWGCSYTIHPHTAWIHELCHIRTQVLEAELQACVFKISTLLYRFSYSQQTLCASVLKTMRIVLLLIGVLCTTVFNYTTNASAVKMPRVIAHYHHYGWRGHTFFRPKLCCFIDACTKVRTCVLRKSFWTDGCARTYDVDSRCMITRRKCCYKDACDGSSICVEATAIIKDSCGSNFGVLATCELKSLPESKCWDLCQCNSISNWNGWFFWIARRGKVALSCSIQNTRFLTHLPTFIYYSATVMCNYL